MPQPMTPAIATTQGDALAPAGASSVGSHRERGAEAMLSLGKLSPGQQEYYLRTVTAGAEEYYTGAKEAPGEWVGESAARLGLAGEVDADVLHWVLKARDPRTGER